VLPKVSAVIPTHNHARFLVEAVESVLRQTVPPSEVIVVDDGSTDSTLEVLRQYGGRIRVISQENRGVAAARNVGASVASGEILAFLDADDLWLERKQEFQSNRFVKEPDLGLVHCGVEEIDGAGRQLRTRLDGMQGWVSREMLLFRRGVILGGGSAIAVRRASFRDVGGFDESLSTSADWDFCYRIARRYRIGFLAEVLVRYRVHNGNMHKNVHAMARDMLRAYSKAFSEDDRSLRGLRRLAYGRLHSILAGSFFQSGDYGQFARHAVKSIVLTPRSARHFAGYPLRRLRRHWAGP
jgi:glycosyltransferase involved in cell wall biosynthesis